MDKISNYLKTRGLFFFILFTIINIISFLPFSNVFIDICSHFRLQYFFISIIFLAIFIWFKKKFLVCALLSLLLTLFNAFEISPYIGKADFFNSKNTFKIALFNVLTQNTNYDKLKNIIQSEKPNIIILQETDYEWIDNITEIKKEYPSFYEYPRLDNFGISIYSKIPLENLKTEFWTEYEVPVISADINYGNKNIKIYCIHTLPPITNEYFKIRNEMFEKIGEIYNKNSKQGLIFAGDLNSTIYSFSYKKYIKNSGLIDAQIQAKSIKGSWDALTIPPFRIPLEHILFSPDLKLNSFKYGNSFGSDHLPVITTFSIN